MSRTVYDILIINTELTYILVYLVWTQDTKGFDMSLVDRGRKRPIKISCTLQDEQTPCVHLVRVHHVPVILHLSSHPLKSRHRNFPFDHRKR